MTVNEPGADLTGALFPSDSDNEIRDIERADMLYRNARLAAVTNPLVGAVILLGFWGYTSPDKLWLWCGAMVLVTLARNVVFLRYQRRDKSLPAAPWLMAYTIGAGLTGAIWGSAILFLSGDYGQWQNELLIFVYCGITAGAVVSASAYTPAVLAFNFPILLPFAIYYFMGGTVTHTVMGIVVILYTIVTLGLARNIHGAIMDKKVSDETRKRLTAEQNLILENASIGIAFIRGDRILQANKFLQDLIGWNQVDVAGIDSSTLFPTKESHQAMYRESLEQMHQGETYRKEVKLVRRDGTEFWCHVQGKALNPGEPAEGSIWLFEDISYRKAMEKTLRQLTAEQNIILETAQAGILFVKGRRIVRCNKFYADLLGYGQEELFGMETAITYTSAEDYEAVGQRVYASLARGEIVETEYQIKRKDGTLFLARTIGRSVTSENPEQGSIWVVEDVTEHRRIENELRNSESRLRRVVLDAPIPIMMHAEGGEVLMISRQWTKLTGYSQAELSTAADWRRKAHGITETPSEQSKAFELMYDGGGGGEQALKTKDGVELIWEFRSSPLATLADGRRTIITMGVDVTERQKMEQKLRQVTLEQSLILENVQIAIALVQDLHIIHANSFFEDLFGLKPNQWLDFTTSDFFPSPEEANSYRKLAFEGLAANYTYQSEQMMKRFDGTLFWGRMLGKSVDRDDPLGAVIWLIEDFSVRRDTEESLRMAAAVFETAYEGIMVTDDDQVITAVNSAMCRMTGYEEVELIGRSPELFRTEFEDDGFVEAAWRKIGEDNFWTGEIWRKRKDGSVFPCLASISAIRNEDDAITRYVTVSTDITQRKEDEKRIWQQANFDPLTQLANRALFLDRLSHELARARRNAGLLSMMFIDLDRFKWVNDTLGHAAGDTLLKEVASRLIETVRESDTVARIGGDEFTIILPEINRLHDAEVVAEKVLESLSRTFIVDGQEVTISSSIGITVFPNDGDSVDILMRNADNAMYQAKETGGNSYCFFTSEMNTSARRRIQFEGELRQALKRQELKLVYQPIIDLANGGIWGAEALIRWENPELGLVLPENFIPLTEDTGLIISIGEWVIEKACTQAAEWQLLREDPIRIAVNVSARQFAGSDPTQVVTRALESSGLPAHCLELEITERLLLEDSANTRNILQALKEIGVTLSIDDFGTGHSALSYLKQFDFDVLKIDSSFIQGIIKSEQDAALVKAIISLAGAFNVKVVAEGVESQEQIDFLVARGCDLAQGFFYGKPVTAKQLSRLIADDLKARNGST